MLFLYATTGAARASIPADAERPTLKTTFHITSPAADRATALPLDEIPRSIRPLTVITKRAIFATLYSVLKDFLYFFQGRLKKTLVKKNILLYL
jgi:hypothetical protein